MEAIFSSETSVDFQWTTRRHIPEEDTLQNHRCENLKSYHDHVVQDGAQWRAFLDTVVNRRVPYRAGNLFTSLLL
jgi:hypothetical protein